MTQSDMFKAIRAMGLTVMNRPTLHLTKPMRIVHRLGMTNQGYTTQSMWRWARTMRIERLGKRIIHAMAINRGGRVVVYRR